ncbi:hypothetical protein TNCV_4393511 [Trichonephila clavipes]|nr:hypothetical protein TNCV_4393511 [Trichonephila clavipes]
MNKRSDNQCLSSPHSAATREVLTTELVILNLGQVARTMLELVPLPPNYPNTPKGGLRASTGSSFSSLKLNDEIGNVIGKSVDLGRQINLEVDNDDAQKLLDSHKQELTINELLEMHEQQQGIEDSSRIQSEDRMTVGNLTEDLSLIKKKGY